MNCNDSRRKCGHKTIELYHLFDCLSSQSLPVIEHPVDTLGSAGLVGCQFVQLEASEAERAKLLLDSLFVLHRDAGDYGLVGLLHWAIDLICVIPLHSWAVSVSNSRL